MKLPDSPLATLAEQRGLSEKTLEAAGIYLVEDGPYRDWWAIPYPHRNGIWKTRYRNPDPHGRPKYKDEPGADFHLYNPLKLGAGEEEVWFTEGEFDTLCLIGLGYPAIGIHGVDNVAQDGQERKRGFREEWKYLFEDTLCITMFDNDEAGLTAGRRLAAFLDGVVFDDWDTQYSDVNEWFADDREGLALAVSSFRDRVRRSRGME